METTKRPTALYSAEELCSMLDKLVDSLTNPSNDELRALVEKRLRTVDGKEANDYHDWIDWLNYISPDGLEKIKVEFLTKI
jgi:hypothetical protein